MFSLFWSSFNHATSDPRPIKPVGLLIESVLISSIRWSTEPSELVSDSSELSYDSPIVEPLADLGSCRCRGCSVVSTCWPPVSGSCRRYQNISHTQILGLIPTTWLTYPFQDRVHLGSVAFIKNRPEISQHLLVLTCTGLHRIHPPDICPSVSFPGNSIPR